MRARLAISRTIAALQIVGASSSAVLLLPAMMQSQMSTMLVSTFVTIYVFLGVAFLSGIWLWNEERRGYYVSVFVQAMQIPVISSSFIIYKIVFGLGVVVRVFGEGQAVGVDIGGQSFLLFSTKTMSSSFGINVWSALVLTYLWVIYMKLQAKNA